MQDVLTHARTQARHWSRLFAGLVEVLDVLHERRDSLLAQALTFLIRRTLDSVRTVSSLESQRDGADLELDGMAAAVDWIRPGSSRPHRSVRNELEILLTLARGLVAEEGVGTFEDLGVSEDDLAHEYHTLRGSSTGSLEAAQLLPATVQERLRELVAQASAETDEKRRVSLELALIRVMRALYALAIGYRELDQPGAESQRSRLPWLAFALGEASLSRPAEVL